MKLLAVKYVDKCLRDLNHSENMRSMTEAEEVQKPSGF